jgi:hypothetical protein
LGRREYLRVLKSGTPRKMRISVAIPMHPKAKAAQGKLPGKVRR